MANLLIQHLKAPNDTNGNPRRLYLVYSSSTGNIVRIIDEGFAGLPSEYRSIPEIPPMNITATEYRAWKAAMSKYNR